MWKIILGTLILASLSQPALARKITTNSQVPSITVTLGDYRKSLPSSVGEDSLFVSADYQLPLTGLESHLGSVFGVQLAPDLYRKTQKVDVREDRYEAYSLARVSAPWLFRFNLDLGPKVVFVRSVIHAFDESQTHSDVMLGVLSRVVVDYSTAEDWEVTLSAQLDYIPHDLKYNYGYGVGLKRYLN